MILGTASEHVTIHSISLIIVYIYWVYRWHYSITCFIQVYICLGRHSSDTQTEDSLTKPSCYLIWKNKEISRPYTSNYFITLSRLYCRHHCKSFNFYREILLSKAQPNTVCELFVKTHDTYYTEIVNLWPVSLSSCRLSGGYSNGHPMLIPKLVQPASLHS